MKKMLRVIIGFAILFGVYHSAEYMVLFANQPLLFLCISFLFFPIAQWIAKRQGLEGIRAFAVTVNSFHLSQGALGLLIGITVNILMVIVLNVCNVEHIDRIPPVGAFLRAALPLVFGTVFSSLTEDVLTRGYIFAHGHKLKPWILVLVSSIIYVLNHIHRLDEPVYLLYLFIVGIQLIIPVIVTGSIWYTLGIHWAGNIVYHLTNSVMHSSAGVNSAYAMWVAIGFMAALIPVNYVVCRLISASGRPYRHSSPDLRHSSTLV